MFTAAFFHQNRQNLAQQSQNTLPIVITAHGQLQRGSDESFPFHQDSNFWYLTGLDVPDIILVIDDNSEYLIVPGRSETRATFEGSIDSQALTKVSGIDTILDEKTGWQQLKKRLKKTKQVATIAAPPKYVDSWGMYTNPARDNLIQRLNNIQSDIEIHDLRSHIARLRSIKQPAEIQAIQRAIDITNQTLEIVTHSTRLATYSYEYEIEADIWAGFRRRGATDQAFPSIIAAGQHACTMHYTENNGPIDKQDFVVIDVGAEWSHYAADITRTVCLGKPTKRQQAVYDAVASVQRFAFSLIRPGMTFRDYEEQIATYMGEKLRELGLVKSISEEAVRQYYPHSTSHFLGLDTHDAGDYSQPMTAGMVITVEPGIYIPEEGIGVRLEDDVLITSDGIKILSQETAETKMRGV